MAWTQKVEIFKGDVFRGDVYTAVFKTPVNISNDQIERYSKEKANSWIRYMEKQGWNLVSGVACGGPQLMDSDEWEWRLAGRFRRSRGIMVSLDDAFALETLLNQDPNDMDWVMDDPDKVRRPTKIIGDYSPIPSRQRNRRKTIRVG